MIRNVATGGGRASEDCGAAASTRAGATGGITLGIAIDPGALSDGRSGARTSAAATSVAGPLVLQQLGNTWVGALAWSLCFDAQQCARIPPGAAHV